MNTQLYCHGSWRPNKKAVLSYIFFNKNHPNGFIQQKVIECPTCYRAQLQAIMYGLADIDNYDNDISHIIAYTNLKQLMDTWNKVKENNNLSVAHADLFRQILIFEKNNNDVQIIYSTSRQIEKLKMLNDQKFKELA